MDAQPKIGQKIKIISLSPNAKGIPDPAEKEYIGKTGIINYIDDVGTIWGTWGGIGILPCDNYEIINKEGEWYGESENN